MPTLVEAEQRSPEWFAARLGNATGSRFGDIVAKTRSGYSASRKNYAAELVTERLTGTHAEGFTTAAMQWGTDNEPVARLQYELLTGNDVQETGFWLHDEIAAGVSPDGFVNHDGLLEIKCPNTATHIETLQKKKLPRQYEAQVQGQMWVMNKQWCDFVSFDPRLPENAQLVIIRVPRDEIYIGNLEANIRDFLREVDELQTFIEEYK